MKFSWKWLNETLNLKSISLNELIHKLTLSGFEVETVIDQPKIQDKTINLSIPANRSDTSSIIGIAREISSILNLPLPNPDKMYAQYYINNNLSHQTCNLENKNLKLEPILDLKFNIITHLTQQKSPLWLKQYLYACDIKPTNTLHDTLSYINLKWGQQIKIFDLNKITKNIGKDFILEINKINTVFPYNNSSDFNRLKIKPTIDLIPDNKTLLSVLGLESHSHLFCDTKTSSIIVIGKNFNSEYINNITSKTHIKTGINNKQRKGIIREDFLYAYKELIQLIKYLMNGHLGILYQYHKPPIQENIIQITKKNINNILGPCSTQQNRLITQENIIQILQQLHFQPTYDQHIFSIRIPEYRHEDIIRPIDVIEEISKISGFDLFIDQLPRSTKIGNISCNIKILQQIRQILRNFGLHEVIHYSLEHKNNISETDKNISLYNPLLDDQSYLRSTLIKNLINASQYNYKKKNPPFECFEIGKKFHNTYNIKEILSLAGIIGNPNFSKKLWSEKNKSMTWFQAKGMLEEFFEKLHANITWQKLESLKNYNISPELEAICHPHRKVIICNKYNKKKIVGIFSQLNKKFTTKLNIDYELYIFEINLLHLINSIQTYTPLNYSFTNYSNYPSVTRDISLTVNRNQSAYTIKQYILSQNSPLIESVEIFNEYQDQHTKTRFIGFRIIYRSNTRTLNDQDIKNIDAEIKYLLQKLILN